MRFFKLGIISIAVFAIILTGFSLLLPSSVNISKAIDINAPADSIHTRISNLNNWKYWYADSTITAVSNPSFGAGSTISFAKTTVRIVSSNPAGIKAKWITGNNEPIEGSINIIRDSSDILSTVQWQFVQKVAWYPWEKFALIVSNKAFGPFMEKSLDNLKAHLERKQ